MASAASTPAAVPGARVRAMAATVIHEVLHEGRSLKALLARDLGRLADPRDRALMESICFETLRWRRRYEHALDTWLARPLPARDAPVHALLLAGLAQLDALGLPAHAALAATAEAARELRRPALVGLVNAVLRRATREPLPDSGEEAVRVSHPDWLLARLRDDWGGQCDAIVAANNRQAPMWLRVNRGRHSTAEALAALAAAGIAGQASPLHAAAIVLDAAVPAHRLPGFDRGEVSVQDGAAQLAVEAMDLASGAHVLDACAAPGGKTAQLLEQHDTITLDALDVDERRLARVASTLARLPLADRARLRAADAADPGTWFDGRAYDAILLDAPCSATGIIRRQPDIKWHRREADIDALAAQQSSLLDALWTTLAPGGALVYATCSVLRAENRDQIDAFLARTPDAVAEPLDARFGQASGAGRQRLPGEQGMDGFFYARLRRRREAR